MSISLLTQYAELIMIYIRTADRFCAVSFLPDQSSVLMVVNIKGEYMYQSTVSRTNLAVMASRRGQSVDQMIIDMIGIEKTVIRVAVKLGVAPNTIRYRLIAQGYRFVGGQWVNPVEVSQS
jgi:hypothetical protein